MVFFTHGNSKLIHDTTVASIEVILRILADQCKICHGKIFDLEQVCQDHTSENFKGSRRGKSGTVRDISPDYHIKTTCDCMSFFFERPDYTKRIVCPVVFFFICQIIKRCFYNTKGVQIHGIKMDLVILSFACGTVSTKCQCTWKYMSTVIICVFTNQIHASRRKVKTSSFGITKKFCKHIKQFFLHHYLPPLKVIQSIRFIYIYYIVNE